jgi:hypothetical protein
MVSLILELILILCCLAVQVYSKTTIMVVLGCANQDVQEERIYAALSYISNTATDEVVWFITGGVKNAIAGNLQSESEQMREKIDKSQYNNDNIILDDKARNTAENFAYLAKWLLETYETTKKDYEYEIVITTSDFHQERASMILNGIFKNANTKTNTNKNTKIQWNLSKTESCSYCWSDERIHMRNVEQDVNNAQHIIKQLARTL